MRGVVWSNRLEWFVLTLPLVFIFLASLELTGLLGISQSQMRTGQFISKIVFLNHVHVYFTLALLFIVPEVRNWFQKKSSEERWFLWRIVAVFIGIFVLYYSILPWMKSFENDEFKNFVIFVTTFAAVVALHHNYSQTLGLSLGYLPEGEFKLRSMNLANIERRLYYTMVGSHAIQLFTAAYSLSDQLIKISLGILAVAGFGMLALAAVYLSERDQIRKGIYMLRYSLYPFIPFSYFALIGILAIHGVEYLHVTHKIQVQSKIEWRVNEQRRALIAILLIGALTTMAIFGRSSAGYWPIDLIPDQPSWVLLLSSISLAFSFLHYHLDAHMFRMSDVRVRETIGRLLFGGRSTMRG